LKPHTDREYESELVRLREQVLLMGAEVEAMIADSIRALVERRSDLARAILGRDRRVDQLELQNDGLCLSLLARRQPVASDLRFIAVVLRIVRDLERAGDQAVNISERVLELNEEPPLKAYVEIPRMAEHTQSMVREALDALVNGDDVRARAVIERDDQVDAIYGGINRILLTYMMENPQNIFRATRLQSIAHNLERISDHATNIAEMVVFHVKGTDIRHRYENSGGPAEPDPARRGPAVP
jgi:phosphate transport system protein